MPTPPTLSGEEHPPKGKAVTSPVCLPVGKLVPILAGGWGWGWLLLPRGCSLLPSVPPSPGRQTLSFAHQRPPWPGVGFVSLDGYGVVAEPLCGVTAGGHFSAARETQWEARAHGL